MGPAFGDETPFKRRTWKKRYSNKKREKKSANPAAKPLLLSQFGREPVAEVSAFHSLKNQLLDFNSLYMDQGEDEGGGWDFMEVLRPSMEEASKEIKVEGEDYLPYMHFLPSPPSIPPMMLCFGADQAQKSSDSSLSTIASSPPPISPKASRAGRVRAMDETTKKARTVGTGRQARAKGSRKKITDQIAALQKVVCPFGKTDTASVLHEAQCYIRFLHEQVQVLSSPYLEDLPASVNGQKGNGVAGQKWSDLRNRGLCLVPMSCADSMANNSNGADLFCSPSSQH